MRDNFSLLKQCLPLKKQSESQEALLMKQSLYFILMAVYQEGIDILNLFRFNYDEPKNQAITHLITQEPQKMAFRRCRESVIYDTFNFASPFEP